MTHLDTEETVKVLRFGRMAVIGRVRVFAMGWREAFDSFGMTFDDDPDSPLSVAYDRGRDLRRRFANDDLH